MFIWQLVDIITQSCKLDILPDHLLLAEENSDRAIYLLLFDWDFPTGMYLEW